MRQKFTELCYNSAGELTFGEARQPVELSNGLTIGGGTVYPEINFTLSSETISRDHMEGVVSQYGEIVEGICNRARKLSVPGLVVEIELLPPTTYNPKWGEDIVRAVRGVLNKYENRHGLKSGLRVTPVDIREDKNSRNMWQGEYWETLLEAFRRSARAGADLLSIESIGGKNLHDEALMYCQLDKSLFSLGVLGVKDMQKLWGAIVNIADKQQVIAAGDTACAFANTAMVLSEQELIPGVFAAVVRVMSAVRSLVALEQGARGPHKDCGYEGIYLKAMTGIPISMEGKSSAVAHLSPVGNIAGCAADLWSNESVQNVKLLGGMAPTISLEQLAYDCRLMNTASHRGQESKKELKQMLAESDRYLNPGAFVLDPEVVVRIAGKIINQNNHLLAMKTAGLAAIEELRQAIEAGNLKIPEKEKQWLGIMESQLESVPSDRGQFIEKMMESYESEKFDPKKYNL